MLISGAVVIGFAFSIFHRFDFKSINIKAFYNIFNFFLKMFLFLQIFLFASANLVWSVTSQKDTTAIPPDKVHLLAKYVTKPYESETEAMEVAKNFVENLVADKSIVRSAPQGFETVQIDQNDRTKVAEVLSEVIKCAGAENRSRRRLRRGDRGKGFAMVMLKKTGEFFQLTIHVFAVFIGLLLGTAAGFTLAVLCSLVGLVQSCAKLCCGCSAKFTPAEGCANGFITGFGTVGYAALWLIEVPLTLNNPIANHAELREKLQDALDDIIAL